MSKFNAEPVNSGFFTLVSRVASFEGKSCRSTYVAEVEGGRLFQVVFEQQGYPASVALQFVPVKMLPNVTPIEPDLSQVTLIEELTKEEILARLDITDEGQVVYGKDETPVGSVGDGSGGVTLSSGALDSGGISGASLPDLTPITKATEAKIKPATKK